MAATTAATKGPKKKKAKANQATQKTGQGTQKVANKKSARVKPGNLIFATRRLKYYCADKQGRPCKIGQVGEPMPVSTARQKPWVYYLETVPLGLSKDSSGPTPDLLTPAEKRKWSQTATRLPVGGSKKDIKGETILFEADCSSREVPNSPELKCPSVGLAVDRDHIFVLGAFGYPKTAEVRQYSLKDYALEKVYMTNLCQTGRTHKVGKNLDTDTPSPAVDALGAEYLGGTLSAFSDVRTGVAMWVYGLATCGTLFRIQPSTGKQELLSAPCTYQYVNRDRTNLFTGLAIQRYTIPGFQEEEVRLIIAYVKQNSKPELQEHEIGKQSVDFFVLSLTKLLEDKRHYGTFQKSTKRWIFPVYNYGECFLKHQEPFLRTINARKLTFAKGSLYWYGGLASQFRTVWMTKTVPCDEISENKDVREMMAGWHGEAPSKGLIKTSKWQTVFLKEDSRQVPWLVKLHSMRQQHGAIRLEKYLVCFKPKPPTTRMSIQKCCEWASSSEDSTCANALLELL